MEEVKTPPISTNVVYYDTSEGVTELYPAIVHWCENLKAKLTVFTGKIEHPVWVLTDISHKSISAGRPYWDWE